jgi:hypothetical protein
VRGSVVEMSARDETLSKGLKKWKGKSAGCC